MKLGPHPERRTQSDSFCEQDVEENIWTYEGRSGRRLDSSA